jgi:hypothetical protein
MELEIENMRQLAKPFLSIESFERIIPDWKQALLNFRNRPLDGHHRWTLPQRAPIMTIISKGEYEPRGRQGGLNVYGTICNVWGIRADQRGTRRGRSSECFILDGIASTKIQIWAQRDNDADFEVARWTLETGDQHSPGCHFHTQIDLEPEDNKFPESLSVPRFPAYLHTPMDALDYLLGELFQERWYRHTSEGRDFVKAWNGCQKHRLVKMLDWHRETFQNAGGSPWATFKRKKPAVDLMFD